MVARTDKNNILTLRTFFIHKVTYAQSDGRTGVPSAWLLDNTVMRTVRHLPNLVLHKSLPVFPGDNKEILRFSEIKASGYSVLEKGRVVRQVQELLGKLLSRKRPESRTAAPSKNKSIKTAQDNSPQKNEVFFKSHFYL
jgi:hypothetical protein